MFIFAEQEYAVISTYNEQFPLIYYIATNNPIFIINIILRSMKDRLNEQSKTTSEPDESSRRRNLAYFIRMVQRDSGLSMKEFCQNAGVNPNTTTLAIQRGSILLKTAMRRLIHNGYVGVFNIEIPETPEAVIIHDIKQDPFDVDWNNYRYLDPLTKLFRNEPELLDKVAKALGITVRALRYNFQSDNCDIRRIYEIAERAGFKIQLVIKKDPTVAAVLADKLKKDNESEQDVEA